MRNSLHGTISLSLLLAVGLGAGAAGCNSPDDPEVAVVVGPRQESPGPYAPPEYEYQMEEPPDQTDPCERLALEIRPHFARAYRDAGFPRMGFLANVVSGEAVRTTPGTAPDENRGTGRAPGRIDALPIDRAAIENHYIDFFKFLDGEVQVIDLEAARGQLDREAATLGDKADAPLTTLRDRNLCDLVVLLEIRVNRDPAGGMVMTGVSRQSITRQGAHSASAHRAEWIPTGGMTLACTARALLVEDGSVLATTVPERAELASESQLGEVLRRIAFCSAADLADRLVAALGGANRLQAVTIRATGLPDRAAAGRLRRWVEDAFPGSKAMLRTFSGGDAEFSVRLNGNIEDLIAKAEAGPLPGFAVDSQRSSARTVTFRAVKE